MIKASCHCKNITCDIELSRPAESYSPRACDCDFCVKHGASYISDSQGKLSIEIKDEENINRYHQGSGSAEFLICKTCGVFVAVTYKNADGLFAAINNKAIEGAMTFDKQTVVSPKTLSADQKTKRWQEVWFQNVKLNGVAK